MYSTDKKYPHYYKKIPDGVTHIDVYRVLDLFNVSDAAIAHAVKKLLVAGNRGYKSSKKDVEEAIASLTRRVEMWEEECVKVPEIFSGTDDSFADCMYRDPQESTHTLTINGETIVFGKDCII